MSRLIFVTTELHPETPGGAGVVVDALARGLSSDRQVTVLLVTPSRVEVVERHSVDVIWRQLPERGFLKRSEAIAKAVSDIAEPGDRIEFHDFEGIGYLSLVHRGDLGLDEAIMTVRFHGPFDLLADAMTAPVPDWALPSAMEVETFRMADQVIIPVGSHRETLVERYGIDADRIAVGPPLVPEIRRSTVSPSTPPVFAAIGRLGEMKGSEDLVAAALQLMDEGHPLSVRFVGGDGWSVAGNTTMTEQLASMIAPEFAKRFEFVGAIPREELHSTLSDVTAVVVPSRFESFCLAAYETRAMGLPLVMSDLPAFQGIFGEDSGALVYNGTVPGLAASMKRLLTEPGLVGQLAVAGQPHRGEPWSIYRTDPSPRHPRAQAGLATAATRRVNEVWEEGQQRNRSDTLQAMYRKLPDGVARWLRKAPQGLKDRAKTYASWPEEVERRDNERRLAAVLAAIDAGDFAELSDPDVTIVVPVHNEIRYLDEALASIYEQTHPSWEIVVVDDGSTDPDAISYLDALSRPRLRLIRQENTGLPGARNRGMAEARGRYLVPLDSDDQLLPEFLARMLPALEAHPEVGYAHCFARLHQDIEAVWVTRPFNPYWQLLGNGIVGCVLLRADAWRAVGGYDETMNRGNEDWELWLRLMKERWGQVQVPEALFMYRKHGISMSVDTESRFEEGRRMVRDRHPDLYDQARLRRLKTRWYPLVTGLVDDSLEGNADLEVITDVAALATTWGKYVVDMRGMSPPPLDLIMEMAAALETRPKAARAVTDGLPPVVVTRRWNLHDSQATPDQVHVVADATIGPEPSLRTNIPRPGWSVPESVRTAQVPVQRQPPEEDGELPDVSRW